MPCRKKSVKVNGGILLILVQTFQELGRYLLFDQIYVDIIENYYDLQQNEVITQENEDL